MVAGDEHGSVGWSLRREFCEYVAGFLFREYAIDQLPIQHEVEDENQERCDGAEEGKKGNEVIQAKGEDRQSDGPSEAGPVGIGMTGETLQRGLVRGLPPFILNVLSASPLCLTARWAGPDLVTNPLNVAPHLLDDL
jgi:hypothetical protein